MPLIFKICAAADWKTALTQGFYEGSAVDRRDGFIHLSTEAQVRETARRHFAGQDGLILIAFEADELGGALAWEPSRGGELFPHIYGGRLDASLAKWARPLPLEAEGHVFPQEMSA